MLLKFSNRGECNKNRTMKEIITTIAKGSFFAGGFGGQGDAEFSRWGCFRSHPCLAAVNVCGAPADDAMCYKYREADETWHAWDFASNMDLSCPARAP